MGHKRPDVSRSSSDVLIKIWEAETGEYLELEHLKVIWLKRNPANEKKGFVPLWLLWTLFFCPEMDINGCSCWLKVTCRLCVVFFQIDPRLPEHGALRRLPRQHVLQQVPPVEVAGEVTLAVVVEAPSWEKLWSFHITSVCHGLPNIMCGQTASGNKSSRSWLYSADDFVNVTK